jgi:hypothetical protein
LHIGEIIGGIYTRKEMVGWILDELPEVSIYVRYKSINKLKNNRNGETSKIPVVFRHAGSLLLPSFGQESNYLIS